MAQVIVFKNPNGSNVAVCYPTGEVPIEQVLAKDCPPGAFIIDHDELPQGEDAQYFDAWELIGSTVVVNAEKKTAIQQAKNAKQTAVEKLKALGFSETEISSLKGNL